MRKGLSVIIPAFNEEDSILQTLHRLKDVLSPVQFPYEIIVVNDGSTDRTGVFIGQAGSDIKHIDNIENLGYGSSIIIGSKHASYEHICITDADGTYPLDMIPEMYRAMSEYDMVVGARIGKHAQIPFIRRPAKFILNVFANYITEKKIPDLNSGLRIFCKSFIDNFKQLLPTGFSFTTTLTVLLHSYNYRVKYFSIEYHKRSGQSKISPIKDTLNFFLLILKLTTYFRPLRIFIPLSTLLFTLGFIKFIHDIIRYHFHISGNTIVILIFAVQFFALGLVADLIVSTHIKSK